MFWVLLVEVCFLGDCLVLVWRLRYAQVSMQKFCAKCAIENNVMFYDGDFWLAKIRCLEFKMLYTIFGESWNEMTFIYWQIAAIIKIGTTVLTRLPPMSYISVEQTNSKFRLYLDNDDWIALPMVFYYWERLSLPPPSLEEVGYHWLKIDYILTGINNWILIRKY